MITIRRLYEPQEAGEKYRVLIDRIWPRGISKEKAGWDEWLKEIAPGDSLRKWFGHDPARWEEFKALYKEELATKQEELKYCRHLEHLHGTLTLLYAARDKEHNNAVVLHEVLQEYGKSSIQQK